MKIWHLMALRRDLFTLIFGICIGYALCTYLLLWGVQRTVIIEKSLSASNNATPFENSLSGDSISQKFPLEISPVEENRSIFDKGAASRLLIKQAALAESSLQATFRSCLGPKCFDEKMKNIDRVGFLSIPYAHGQELMDSIGLLNTEQVEVTYETNVPPYGYGKNHGWSRIIRIVRPIYSHAYEILRIYNKFSGYEQTDRQLYDQQIRQIIRWQCRLSHVAAHTRMLTVFTDDIHKRPKIELEKIMSFIGANLLFKDKKRRLQDYFEKLASKMNETFPYTTIPSYLIEAGLNAINDEMKESQDLSAWPCKLFSKLDSNLPLKPDIFGPNCTERFVKCTIKLDKLGA